MMPYVSSTARNDLLPAYLRIYNGRRAIWPWVASPPNRGSLSCRHEQPGGKAHLVASDPGKVADPSTLSAFRRVAVTTEAPLHPRDLRDGAGVGAPAILGLEQRLRAPSEDGDVLSSEGVDAFEGQAVGVEVPEEPGHGGGEAAYRIPVGGQGQGVGPV